MPIPPKLEALLKQIPPANLLTVGSSYHPNVIHEDVFQRYIDFLRGRLGFSDAEERVQDEFLKVARATSNNRAMGPGKDTVIVIPKGHRIDRLEAVDIYWALSDQNKLFLEYVFETLAPRILFRQALLPAFEIASAEDASPASILAEVTELSEALLAGREGSLRRFFVEAVEEVCPCLKTKSRMRDIQADFERKAGGGEGGDTQDYAHTSKGEFVVRFKDLLRDILGDVVADPRFPLPAELADNTKFVRHAKIFLDFLESEENIDEAYAVASDDSLRSYLTLPDMQCHVRYNIGRLYALKNRVFSDLSLAVLKELDSPYLEEVVRRYRGKRNGLRKDTGKVSAGQWFLRYFAVF